jgi:hypothetical protein
MLSFGDHSATDAAGHRTSAAPLKFTIVAS